MPNDTKILIVEDDTLLSRMYEKAFKFEKYEVHVARNGKEGVSAAKKLKPDFILLDIMMPEMNGLEALDKLKADKDTKNIPVVMLTNLSGDEDVESALSKGALKFIVKSEHDPKEVVDMVKELIGK